VRGAEARKKSLCHQDFIYGSIYSTTSFETGGCGGGGGGGTFRFLPNTSLKSGGVHFYLTGENSSGRGIFALHFPRN